MNTLFHSEKDRQPVGHVRVRRHPDVAASTAVPATVAGIASLMLTGAAVAPREHHRIARHHRYCGTQVVLGRTGAPLGRARLAITVRRIGETTIALTVRYRE